jgi:CRP/FNR family transcriptional regulator, cyclic AMP receptor protein
MFRRSLPVPRRLTPIRREVANSRGRGRLERTTETRAQIPLLKADPSFAQFLSEDEREEARRVNLPLRAVPRGELDVCRLLDDANAFAGLILDGMLVRRSWVGEQAALRLVGPGDFLSLIRQQRSMLFSGFDCRVLEETQVAMLGREVLVGVRHWPLLASGLYVRFAEQSDRVEAQLAICQLPRVDERILAMLWLLAESWGRVTPAGTWLPVKLTHGVLGGLVGARRSTVTLALGQLADRGALIRADDGWLLLEMPESVGPELPKFDEPRLSASRGSPWWPAPDRDRGAADVRWDDLLGTVQRLRRSHELSLWQVQDRLQRLKVDRAQRDESRRGRADS